MRRSTHGFFRSILPVAPLSLVRLVMMMALAATLVVQTRPTEAAATYNEGAVCATYTREGFIGTGDIPETEPAGAEISGLVPGNWYAVETRDGPWFAFSGGGGPPQYGAWVSNDNGATWYRLNQGASDGYDFTSFWGAATEPIDTVYRRGFFQATTTSIRIRVADSVFDDNSGSLSWVLYNASKAERPCDEAPCSRLIPDAFVSTGDIPETEPAGAEISGLVPGNWYAVETRDGPWFAFSGGGGPPQYGAWVSNDNGATWYRLNQGASDGYDFTSFWGAATEPIDTVYRRGFFQATTTSIRIRVADSVFDDNSGKLSWALYTAATVDSPCGQPDVVGECASYTVVRSGQDGYAADGWSGNIFVGSPNADTIDGTTGPDLMLGLGGNDRLYGRAGNDVLCGGDGNDRLEGIDGDDILDGGDGDDTLLGGNQPDQLAGGEGNDTLDAGKGNDTLEGGPGNDILRGSDQADVVNGGEGADRLYGGADADSLDGGAGNDYLEGDDGNDTIVGGADHDTLKGENGNDTLTGDGDHASPHGADSFSGGSGSDSNTDFTPSEGDTSDNT